MKLENVSGCRMWIDESRMCMNGRGTPDNVKLAEKYCKCLIMQRKGQSEGPGKRPAMDGRKVEGPPGKRPAMEGRSFHEVPVPRREERGL